MKTIKRLLLLCLVAVGSIPATHAAGAAKTGTPAPTRSGEEVTFSYSDLQDEFAMWGTSSKETYDVAIRLVSPEMAGCRITGFSVPMFATDGVENISVWLSKELNVANKLNVPDIMSVPAEIKDDYVKVSFSEPYTLTEEGVYIGYTFTVTKTGDQATNKPIALTYGKNPNGFYFHTNRTQLSWTDKSSSLGGITYIAVNLEGEFPKSGATVSYPSEMNISSGTTPLSVPVTFNSIGTDPVKSLTFSYSVGETAGKYEITYPQPWETQYLLSYSFNVDLPIELSEGMNYVKVNLTEVNGEKNPLASENEIAVYCYNAMLKKRPVVEEYTGLWCGWCPKGYVALERMAEQEEDFIGVAIHSGDVMQTLASTLFPNEADGLPTAWIDRTYDIDPSYSNVSMAWNLLSRDFTYAAIDATADDSTPNHIKATSNVYFERPVTDDYAIFYYLLGNGMTDKSWLQTNYFSGKSPEAYPGMEQFINAEGKVPGLVFNDVLLMFSNPKGEEGSLPPASEIEPGKLMTHEYDFDLTKIESLQDFDLRKVVKYWSVVAGVVNQRTGEITNAVKIDVGDTAVGEISEAEYEVIGRDWIDISGLPVSETAKGLLIERQRLSDGRTKYVKVIR